MTLNREHSSAQRNPPLRKAANNQVVAEGHAGTYPSPGPRVSDDYNISMFYRNRNIAAIFNALRLHLRLVRALQITDGQ